MMIAPIVFCTIVSGINSIIDSHEVGRTLVRSMALFYLLTVLALLAGLIAISLIQPGARDDASHRPGRADLSRKRER